jgi:hypothetical protein
MKYSLGNQHINGTWVVIVKDLSIDHQERLTGNENEWVYPLTCLPVLFVESASGFMMAGFAIQH